MRLDFRIVNVFTVGDDRLSGNPLCVFEDARGLTGEQMQALARQLNLSETTFVLPSERADAHVRIFTPSFEMPFAGHPTLGTASVVAKADQVTLEMKAGLVNVAREGRRWTLRTARPPRTRPVEVSRDDVGRMLGLDAPAIAAEPLWVDTGVEQLVIPVASVEAVRAAKPVPELLSRWGYSQARDEAMAYLFCESSPEWTVRFFFTSQGALLEDPATGSACANLGGYLIATGRRLPLRVTLRQGEAIGRPSRLHLDVDTDGGVFVGGEAIELGRGTITL